jgi:hypothetical protein
MCKHEVGYTGQIDPQLRGVLHDGFGALAGIDQQALTVDFEQGREPPQRNTQRVEVADLDSCLVD